MISVDDAAIARSTRSGMHFEILVDPDRAMAYRTDRSIDLGDVLAVEKVFTDAKKGLAAQEKAIMAAFKTIDQREVAKEIILHGEIQTTQEHRKREREMKLSQIIYQIHRNAVDPKTHAPHPQDRITRALAESKFSVDDSRPASEQVDAAIKAIRPILPLKVERKEIEIRIPQQYAAKSYAVLNSFGQRKKEEWQGDGSLVAVLDIPGGQEEELHSRLNELCHGEVQTKIRKTS